MPRWIKKILVKIFIRIILNVLREYLSEDEHAAVVASIKNKISVRT